MARKKRRRRQIVISGLVTPMDWDESRNPVRVSLVTDAEKKIEVVDDDTGRELLDYLYEQVRAWGFVDDYGGQHLLQVQRFELIELDEHESQHWDDYGY